MMKKLEQKRAQKMYHEWGDKDFDWKALDKAMCDIRKWTRYTTAMKVLMKEEYGTIRYEFFFGRSQISILSFLQMKAFEMVVYGVCRRYSHIAPEIVDELLSAQNSLVCEAMGKRKPMEERLFQQPKSWQISC